MEILYEIKAYIEKFIGLPSVVQRTERSRDSPHRLHALRATLRAVETERPRVAKLVADEGFRLLDDRLELLALLHAEGAPREPGRLRVELPETDDAPAIEDRV